ncbi:MAG: two-component system, OmpR family, sensor histidine kinase MtrB [Pseudonocardiales bacterium]|jgi:two-component system sensor histidine kinase MtrB|nr:two-component system, OmpR family, sensor histidine kinase MtrB [Pseudonocardiales bacterium]MDT7661909.1 two-component system, OmpR family, sensor histidine kinase MtrB [Pseudonocardiales bacterium]MDT7684096.1 two-component system, OmpR family, sensor histidine kinase MtrB [Pseudonocardiales bacterium]MDT7773663.1 two-component system, OmpR family, sensor histidine kinase MtrB [Pseudonocardiales bacterium]
MTARSAARRAGALVLRIPGARRTRAIVRGLGHLFAELRAIFGAAWRRSLQLRVAVSTLALCAGVLIVLGLLLQTEIAERLVQGKVDAARIQMETATAELERDLSGVNPDDEYVEGTLNKALDRLSVTTLTDQPSTQNAGDFRAVLATEDARGGNQAWAGRLDTIPLDLRRAVQSGALAVEFKTVDGVPMVIYGQPVRTAGRDLQFYLLFSLAAEQRTLGLVQSTLIVGGLVLVLLLAAVTSLVTRQVVRPVQQAAEVAERFADGHLEERMPVKGDDEVARLAESYNEMAGSIQSQIRQLEEFGALQRRFTSDVSHELRTPLTTVRMAADVLFASRDQLPHALRRSSELLVEELDRFEALLADLLEISRLDAGMAELGAERTDMQSVVRRAVEAVRGLAEESGTRLELDVPPGVYAEIDPRRVERIVRNLVANALDHGEGRPIQIRLGADEDSVAVLVRDHGLGLRPGEAGLVFNRFWRADSSRARRSGGTGLGLSISLEDARLHGGWLQAWGEPGRGAAFRLTLPRTVGGELDGSPLTLVPTDEPLDGALLAGAEPAGSSATGPAASVPGLPASTPASTPASSPGAAPGAGTGSGPGSTSQNGADGAGRVSSAGIGEQW